MLVLLCLMSLSTGWALPQRSCYEKADPDGSTVNENLLPFQARKMTESHRLV